MKVALQILKLLCIYTGIVHAAVRNATSDDLGSLLQTQELVLANFFIPWQEPSQALLSSFEAVNTLLQGNSHSSVSLVNIDCSLEQSLCDSHNIISYPAIREFRNQKEFRYRGSRDVSSLIAHVQTTVPPAVSQVDASNIAKIRSSGLPLVLSYLGEDQDDMREILLSLANGELRGRYTLGVASDLQLISTQDVSTPTLVLQNSDDELEHIMEGVHDMADIIEFLQHSTGPLVGKLDLKSRTGLKSYGEPLRSRLSIGYTFAETAEERSALAGDLKCLALQMRGKVIFVTVDAKAFDYHARNLNVAPDRLPAFVLEDTATGDTLVLDQDEPVTLERVRKLIDDAFRHNTPQHTLVHEEL